MSQPYQSILSNPAPSPYSQDHPMFYAESRKDFLSELSHKYSTKIRVPTVDLKRNVTVNYYLDKYEIAQK